MKGYILYVPRIGHHFRGGVNTFVNHFTVLRISEAIRKSMGSEVK